MKKRSFPMAVAQLGPIHLADSREAVVARLLELLRESHARGAKFVVFPELALTTFFPRYWMEDQAEVDRFFERSMPNAATQPLFDRKIHLPGHDDHKPQAPFQHLEKRYFQVGDEGFKVWRTMDSLVGMCICNDRRWPETFRVMGLQGAEVAVLGYNTPSHNIHWAEPPHLRMFHHLLLLQAHAHQNALWVGAAGKCGAEDGFHMIGGSAIVSPTGEIAAQASTEDDEVIFFNCDLALGDTFRQHVFNFAKHRRPEHYSLIVERVGAGKPLTE